MSVLFIAVIWQIETVVPDSPKPYQGSLRHEIEMALNGTGVKIEFLPLATSYEMKQRINEALNYDDAIYAVLQSGRSRIYVYIAYWSTGKMSSRLIAGHTPDICWVCNGWVVEKAESEYRVQDGKNRRYIPAEYRIMSSKHDRQHVLFWHIADRKSISYKTQGAPPWYATFTDIMNNGARQRPEQIFIRINSNDDLSVWPWNLLSRMRFAMFMEDSN